MAGTSSAPKAIKYICALRISIKSMKYRSSAGSTSRLLPAFELIYCEITAKDEESIVPLRTPNSSAAFNEINNFAGLFGGKNSIMKN